MPLLTLTFDPAIGPNLVVGIGFPQSLRPPSTSTPPYIGVRMLVDTGAARTAIAPTVAERLALPALGLVPMISASHSCEVKEYLADMHLPVMDPPVPLRDCRLIEFPMGTGPIEGLLGRDLLTYCLLEVNGPARHFTIAF